MGSEPRFSTNSVFTLRDLPVLGTFIYTGVRVAAISRLRMQDLRDHGEHRSLQFAERGGKSREIPVHRHLDEWVATYLQGAGLTDAPEASPLFPAGERRSSPLTERAMSPIAVHQMLKRRLAAAGLPSKLSPHSFRVLVITDLLRQNVPLEDVRYLAGHAHPRTAQIYAQRRQRVSQKLVERFSV